MQKYQPQHLSQFYNLLGGEPTTTTTQVHKVKDCCRRDCGGSCGITVKSITQHSDVINPSICNNLGPRVLNPYRWALEACEPGCGHDVCREYGDRVAAYFECKSRGGGAKCKNPTNPIANGCKRDWN